MAARNWPLLPTLLSFGIAAAFAFLLTPAVRNFARRHGWVDRPDGGRKLHLTPVPRLGGVAVYGAFALACAILALFLETRPAAAEGVSPGPYIALLVACAAVAAIGVADDIYGVGPPSKLLVQSLAALYLFFNGYQITALSNPLTGESVELGLLSGPLTVVWFVGMSNAFNLIDGLDGLAAGLGLFSTTTLFIACVINERWEIATIAAAMGGALLGFLRYNFNPASIFLGDSGALFIGFGLAAIAVRGSMKSSAVVAVAAPLMAFAVPILDASIAVFRRLVRGDGVFQADGDHIHHRLLRMGLTPRRVVILLYGVAAVFGALSLLTMTSRSQIVGMVVIASSVVTWIGVQQLGYAEFAEIQRSLRYGFVKERRSVGNNVYLASLAQRFAEADGVERLWAILIEAAGRLQFESVWLHIVRERSAVLGALKPVWKAGARRAPSGASATWTVPLATEGMTLGTLILTRAVTQPLQFDPTYLMNAVGQGFAARLRALIESSPAAARPPADAVSTSA
jgi:UDP-GlcNAc:undecaprenyl-phosphate/decaprenyl-phosphate GlcNAc-1-phosphate transferase